MPRWMGIDFGSRRIGLAVGDTETRFAGPLKVLPAEPAHRAIAQIVDEARQQQVAGVAVGWPLNMDDSEGPQGVLTRRFAAALASASGLDVRLWDERLSSFAADSALAGHLTRAKRRARQDAVAAAHILQDFLNRNGPQDAPRATEPPAEGPDR